MGGVRARPLDGAWVSCEARKLARRKMLRVAATTCRLIFMEAFYQKSCGIAPRCCGGSEMERCSTTRFTIFRLTTLLLGVRRRDLRAETAEFILACLDLFSLLNSNAESLPRTGGANPN